MKKLLVTATLAVTFALSGAFAAPPAEACPCSKSKQSCSAPKGDGDTASKTAKQKKSKQRAGKRG